MIIAKKITINILQILIYLLPITFILGNLIINIFILLISILGVLYFKKNLLDFKDKKIIYFISSFFLLLLFSTLFELFVHGFYPDWIKAILYLRFFLLLLVIKALVSSGLLNLNYFLSSCFLFPIKSTCVNFSWSLSDNQVLFYLNQTKSFARDTTLRSRYTEFDYTIYSYDWILPWFKDYFVNDAFLNITIKLGATSKKGLDQFVSKGSRSFNHSSEAL